MPFLAAAGYDCYAVSLRGQGGSERQEGMKPSSLAQHAADLRHILSSLQGPAVLIGHSFGGLVVQRWARSLAAPNWQPSAEAPMRQAGSDPSAIWGLQASNGLIAGRQWG